MLSDFSPSSDGFFRSVYGENPAQITLIDAAGAISAVETAEDGGRGDGGSEPSIGRQGSKKTADDVWRDIMEGKSERRQECKVEAPEKVLTLEDFLAKAGAAVAVEVEAEAEVVEDAAAEEDVKVDVSIAAAAAPMGVMFGYDPLVMGFENGGGGGMEEVGGRGKRKGGPLFEPLDKAAQQRQRRMIKNRESAARSRERKQAYQVELEVLAAKLEEENEQLLREKAERTRERYKQLMEKVVPVMKKKRPPHVLRRVRSSQW